MQNKAKIQLPFSSCAVSFFVYSTEESERIFAFLNRSLGIQREELTTETLEGYFGNIVLSAKSFLIGGRADYVADRIFKSLDPLSRQKFRNELEKSVDEHDAIYLRLDRQSLSDSISLSDEEPIHIKLKPKNRYERAKMLETYGNLV